ncbi:MAG: aldose 1-epimerase, partial [Caldimonas sp.]
MSSTPNFELHSGALRLALRPDLGGAIAGLWHRDMPILRSVEPAALGGARAAACYPLVPYSNRLGFRHFRWKGAEYATQPNFDASPHSLHGVGWMRRWDI